MRKGTAHDKPRQPTGELPRISPATPPAAKPGGRVPAAGKASQSRKDGWPQGMFRRTDGRFRFERMVSGTKHRFSLPFTEAVAIKTASRANELLAEGRSIEHLKKAQKVSFTKFLAEMRTLTKQKRPATRKSERARLKTFAKFLHTKYPSLKGLAAFTPEHARAFLNWRATTPVPRNGSPNSKASRQVPSSATLSEDVRILRAFFKVSKERHWITENPFDGLRTPKQPQRPEFKGAHGLIKVDEYDIRSMIRVPVKLTALERVRDLITRRANTSALFRTEDEVREMVQGKYAQSEMKRLLKLEPKPEVLEGECLLVSKRFTFRPKGTSGNVPLTPESRAILLRRKAGAKRSPFVFPHPDGGRLRSSYWNKFKDLLKAANLAHALSHLLT
jgi:hypothetical protein